MNKQPLTHYILNLIAVVVVVLVIIASLGYFVLVNLAEELTTGLRLVIFTATGAAVVVIGAVVIGALVAVGKWILTTYIGGSMAFDELAISQERVKKARHETSKAAVMSVSGPREHQIHIRDVDPSAIWRPAHLDPRIHVNGQPSLPSFLEIGVWQQFNDQAAADLPPPATHPLLPPGPQYSLPERIDLFDLMPGKRGNLHSIVLGVKVDEQTGHLRTVTAPVWRLVHIANGGATDSGKSNNIRSIAAQVVTAGNTQVVFVDLKRQTFKPFSACDNLLYPIVTDVTDFTAVLSELQALCDERLKLFEPHLTVETIHEYNQMAAEPLSYVVLFIDEISNLIESQLQKDFFKFISMSRAAGVYCVCAGQTWSYRVIQTIIRQQFRTAFHFATNDPNSSRMLLNDTRATDIEVQGRAYVALPFGIEKNIIEVQTPYLDLNTVVGELAGSASGPARSMPSPPPPDPDEKDRQIIAAIAAKLRAGKRWSRSSIARDILGDDGGNQLKRVDQTLEQFGHLIEGYEQPVTP